jgi:hypothetical protein
MDSIVSLELAKLLQEKKINIEGINVFDLTDNNKLINFKDEAVKEFVEDCETGYRDKALYYLIDSYKRTDNNTDYGFFMVAPTITEVVMFLYNKHKIWISVNATDDYKFQFQISIWSWYEIEKCFREGNPILGETIFDTHSSNFDTPKDAYEAGINYTLLNFIKI